jgi:hypothetical protein
LVGAPGDPAGVAGANRLGKLEPATFDARTRNAYGAPFARPVTVAVVVRLVVATDHVIPPSDDISTMYPVIEAPPLCEGADHESCTCASPATATGVPGRLGTAEGIAVVVALAAPTPAKVIALTRTE